MTDTAANATLPATLAEAHDRIRELTDKLQAAQAKLQAAQDKLQKLEWHNASLKKHLYAPSADRAATPETYSKEQLLLDVFGASPEPPATENVVQP